MTTDIAIRDQLMPALTIQEAIARYNATVEFVQGVMKRDLDFGVIPGTGTKPTLLKPGAEKLCTLFGLVPEFETVNSIVDFDAGLFYFHYRCRLTRAGATAATGEGSCNSKEKKYRYRYQDRACPVCGKAAIIKGKAEYGGGWLCFAKKGGCGAKWPDDAPEIVGQAVGQVENTEPFDLINTLQKMAQKRALVAAVLIAANASEFFTQDVEDLEIIEGEVVDERPASPSGSPKHKPASGPNGKQAERKASETKPTGKPAAIQTGEWGTGAAALAARCPYYQKDGKPSFYHMLGAAGKLGFTVVNDANLGAVLNHLEEYAEGQARQAAAA